jgi:hypothetical protein
MKKLFTFKINKINTIEKQVEREVEGKKITVVEKEEEVVPQTFFIRKPTRADYDDAEFFYDKLFSDNVRAGILTRSEIIKRFSNEDVAIKKVHDDYIAKENELQRLGFQEKTEENIEKRKKLENELLNILIEIHNFELNKSSVFDRTAENRSRGKTILWWILHLSCRVVKNKEGEDSDVQIFNGATYKEKEGQYDDLIESDDKFIKEALQRFFLLIPAWYSGNLNTEEDFKKAIDLFDSELRKNKETADLKEKEALEEKTKVTNNE